MKRLFWIVVIVTFFNAKLACAQKLESGQWQGAIIYQKGKVPFDFKVNYTQGKPEITIQNGEEEITLNQIVFENDSVTILLQPFDTWLKAKIEGQHLTGYWKKGYRSKTIPFEAHYQKMRFGKGQKKDLKKVIGKWQLEFRPPASSYYPSVGLMSALNDELQASFLTEVGDLRYFKGIVKGDSLMASSFDGAHAFLFQGRVIDGELSGQIVMDNTYAEEIVGRKDENASIPVPFKEIPAEHRPFFDILSAGDPDTQVDETVYYGKVLVLQLFGTWCPNSLDQTQFLKEWYNEKPKEVEILAVAYEPNFSTAYGNQRIEDYKTAMNLPYELTLGGELSKGQAALAFPHIKKINAFPTLIVVDKYGFIRYEFSYFNGPATGTYYEEFITKFKESIDKLIEE